jgi:glycosyltransferase involved in cell wall biosynthesis
MTTDPAAAKRSIRVLAVTNMWPSPPSPSRGSFVRDAIDTLRKERGLEIDVAVVADRRGHLDYVRANLRVARAARRFRPDVLHVHYGLSLVATLLTSGTVPRVVTFYGSDINLAWQRRLARFCLFLRPAASTICVAENLARRCPSPNPQVIPNGIDLSIYSPRDTAAARERCGLPATGTVVLFAARPTNTVKDHGRFRRVLDRVRAAGHEVHEVHFDGQTDHDGIIDRLAAADLLLFTSRRGSEGSPTVVKEALAMNLPVVSTDVGDVRERLQGVHPSEVASWGRTDGETDSALVGAVQAVVAAGRRSNGREYARAFDSELVADRVATVLFTAARRP